MPLRVGDHAELQATVLSLRLVDRSIRRTIDRATRDTLTPVWRQAVESKLVSRADRAVIGAGVSVKGGNPPTAQAAMAGRPLRGGLVPNRDWPWYEFGAIARNRLSTYTRTSPKGRRHKVTRHASRQLPARVASGRIAFPAVAESAPRIVSLWVQLVMREYAKALGVSRGQ